MEKEKITEELEEELNEEIEVEQEKDTTENTDDEEKNTVVNEPVELLQYRSKEEIIKEIDDFIIDDSLTLEEKINKCRFEEELVPLIQDLNFEELILIETFSGNAEKEEYWKRIKDLVDSKLYNKKSDKLLPNKKDYIKTKIEEDKRKIDAENRKRKEAAMPKPKPKEAPKPKPTKYKYPFKLHFAGHDVETDHIFENEKEYTPEEITKKMLEHQFYEFAGSVNYTYLEKENVLIPIFQQYKKG